LQAGRLKHKSFSTNKLHAMLSFLTNVKSRRTTLVFPNDQKLWTFFAMVEAPEFRIESSKFLFSGRLQEKDIELAKEKLGASELKEEHNPVNYMNFVSDNLYSFTGKLRSFFM
jgi:hypothetical protein